MMKKIFIVSVISVFWSISLIDAALESKIQQELGIIDDLSNKAFGNIEGMKATIQSLMAENERLKGENAQLIQNIASQGKQASNLGVAMGADLRAANVNSNVFLASISENLNIIREKLEKTNAAAERVPGMLQGTPLQGVYMNTFEQAKGNSAQKPVRPLSPSSQRGQLMADINKGRDNINAFKLRPIPNKSSASADQNEALEEAMTGYRRMAGK